MNAKRAYVASVAFLIGGVVGFVLCGFFETADSSIADIKAKADSSLVRELSDLRKENQALAAENTHLRDRAEKSETVANEAALGPGRIYRFSKKELLDLDIPTLDYQQHLTDEVKKFLRLTPDEASKLDGLLVSARSQLRDLQAQHTTILSQKQNPLSISVSIAPFAQEGQAIHTQLSQNATSLLGDERADTFMTLVDGYCQDRMRNYGSVQEEVTVAEHSGGYAVMTKKANGETMMTVSASIPEEVSNIFDVQSSPLSASK